MVESESGVFFQIWNCWEAGLEEPPTFNLGFVLGKKLKIPTLPAFFCLVIYSYMSYKLKDWLATWLINCKGQKLLSANECKPRLLFSIINVNSLLFYPQGWMGTGQPISLLRIFLYFGTGSQLSLFIHKEFPDFSWAFFKKKKKKFNWL